MSAENGEAPPHLRLVLNVRRLWARVLPRAFRDQYGEEMERAFLDRMQDARGAGTAAGRWIPLLRLLLEEMGDLLVAGYRVRRDRQRARAEGSAGGLSDGWGFGALGSEARMAFRLLRRHPGFAAVSVSTLAVGIGGATAMFALVEDILLAPLPYPEADRLVQVFQTNPELGWQRGPVSFPNFRGWQEEAGVFESLSAFQMGVQTTLMGDGPPRPLRGTRVTGETFRTLGVPALFGRTILPSDEGPGRPAVVLLSNELWRQVFGSDPGIVGTTVLFDEEPHTVVGIMPPDFPRLWTEEAFWVPFRTSWEDYPRDENFLSVLGRLRRGVTPEEAQVAMESLIRRMEPEFPEGNEGRHAHVETRARVVTAQVEDQLLLLLGAVGLLLLIACANLAGLSLARGEDRGREMALKAALGASRGRVVRGLFMESLAVALAGALLAIPFGNAMISLVIALGPANLPRRAEVGLDPWSVTFAGAMSLFSALLFGLLPAWRSTRENLTASLKEGGERSSARTPALQQGLVVVQVALACVLLSGAGLLTASLLRLQAVDKGFDEEGVLSFRVRPPGGSYETPEEIDAFYDRLLDRFRGLPGVSVVGATWALPFSGSFASSTYRVEGRPDDEEYLLQLMPIRGDYFRAMETPLLQGRSFQDGEGLDGRLVTVVNQTLADRVWPGENPVGKRLRKGSGEDEIFIEVIGKVPDMTLQALGEDPLLQTFWPHEATPWARELFFTLRTEVDPLTLVAPARQAMVDVDPRVPLADVSTMASRVAQQLSGPRFRTLLVGGFAAVAGLLSILGIYGITAFVVARRTREIGVRMALGARGRSVMIGVLGRGLRLASTGLGLGLVGAVLATRAAGGILFRAESLEPLVFTGVVTLILLATLGAAWAPARRAARLDPMSALRE